MRLYIAADTLLDLTSITQRTYHTYHIYSFYFTYLTYLVIPDSRYLAYIVYTSCLLFLFYLLYLQNRSLLETLRKLKSTGGTGHILVFNTLAIGHTKHPNEQRIACWPFVQKTLRGSNRQDFVFIRPPGISHGAFEFRMDNVWFCKVLLLFQIDSKTDLGWKRHSCAFVSVLEEYTGPRRPCENHNILSTLSCFRQLIILFYIDYLRYLVIF